MVEYSDLTPNGSVINIIVSTKQLLITFLLFKFKHFFLSSKNVVKKKLKYNFYYKVFVRIRCLLLLNSII